MGWALPCDVSPRATVPRRGECGERGAGRPSCAASETTLGEKDGGVWSPAGRVEEGTLGAREWGPGACRPRGSLLGEGVTARHSERRREHVPGLSDVTAQRPRRLQ